MRRYRFMILGAMVFLGGFAVLSIGMPMVFNHSFKTGVVVTLLAMATMVAGLLVALAAWIHVIRSSFAHPISATQPTE